LYRHDVQELACVKTICAHIENMMKGVTVGFQCVTLHVISLLSSPPPKIFQPLFMPCFLSWFRWLWAGTEYPSLLFDCLLFCNLFLLRALWLLTSII